MLNFNESGDGSRKPDTELVEVWLLSEAGSRKSDTERLYPIPNLPLKYGTGFPSDVIGTGSEMGREVLRMNLTIYLLNNNIYKALPKSRPFLGEARWGCMSDSLFVLRYSLLF